MRITGGIYRSRRLQVPAGIRPAQDRVREAIFSMLGQDVLEARVLDLFAGSGAYGLEAISRGAASAVWVEKQPRVHRVLVANVTTILEDDAAGRRCRRMDVARACRPGGLAGPFDLVFADPPYAEAVLWRGKTLSGLKEAAMLSPDGLVVCEQSSEEPVAPEPGWDLLKDKIYGQTRIAVFALGSES